MLSVAFKKIHANHLDIKLKPLQYIIVAIGQIVYRERVLASLRIVYADTKLYSTKILLFHAKIN